MTAAISIRCREPKLEKIPFVRPAALEEAVRELRISFLVEYRDWESVTERFHREIEREHVVLEN
ncbi:MAG: hypothetical protein OXN84_06280 [Albidovulum sp.]|nr:hypothetical protein [Albidovulum sp.]